MSGWQSIAIVIGVTIFLVMGAFVALWLFVSWPAEGGVRVL